jgi:hypothetical protein
MTANRRSAGNLAAAASERKRGGGLRAIGVAVSDVAAPIVRRRGGGTLGRLKTEWAAIVGAPWQDVAWPVALGRDGALKLHVASGAALELQHRAPLLIARINGFFGRPVATRLALVQGPLPLTAIAAPPALPPPAEREAPAIEDSLSAIEDPELRAALARLGRALLGPRRPA